MVQTTFSVGNAGSLTTVLQEISTGGTDAATNTAYAITMTAGVSLSAAVSLDAGSSLTLEGAFPFIVPAFTVTGTVATDLNFTGTISLLNGVLNNPALDTNLQGTVVAGLFSGSVLGITGDAGDTAINSGTIQSTGTYAAVQFASGTIENGWNGPSSALITGVPEGVRVTAAGLVQNGGTIIGSGAAAIAVVLGQGTIDNGQIGETGALLSGYSTGVDIIGAGAVNNDGTIVGTVYDGVFLGSGLVTNGQLGVETALIEGGPGGNGVWIGTGVGTVDNFATIIGGGANGVYLAFGGTVTNGASTDPGALIAGAADGALLLGAGSLLNYGTVLADGSDAAQSVIGVFFDAGGTIQNLATTSLVGGLEWGVVVEGGAGVVTNLGTIQAAAAAGLGVDLTAGGTVVNEAGATILGGTTTTAVGVRVSAGAAGAGAVVVNDGTIQGAVGVDFHSGVASAGTLTNDGLIASTGGASGDAVVFGTGAETLVVQSAGTFIGGVVGSGVAGSSTTLELASGTQGTLSGLANNGGTVTDSAGSFVFSATGTVALDAGALWTVTAPGTFNTLHNAGALGISGGAVTVTGSLGNSGSLSIANGSLTATTGVVTDQGVITVGAGGLLKANGTGISTAGTGDIQVGGPSAVLNVTGAGATVNTNGHQLGIGTSGEGSVLISQGGTVLAGTPFAADNAVAIGGSVGATGGLTVTGLGSLLRSTGQVSVGLAGNGSLLIENQGSVITGNNTVDASQGFDVGTDSGASGDVTVTGTQSLLSNTGRFIVGDAGLGSLSIQSGGTVITTPGTVAGLAGAVIANTASASGSSVTVTGTGSAWRITGTLQVGDAGAGALSVTNGASVTAAALDAGILDITTEGTGQITLSGPNAALTVTGNATVGDAGSANLSIVDGATFAAANLTIGAQGTGSGAVFLSDAGSVLDITGTLNVGTALGVGELTIGPSATVIASKVVLQGEVVNEGGLLDPNEIDVLPGAALVVLDGGSNGGIGDIIVNDYSIEAKSGTKPSQKIETLIGTIVGSFGTLSGTGLLVIDNASTLALVGGPVDASQSVEFAANTGALVVGDIAGFQAIVTSFAAGDTIIVDTPGPATFSQTGSIISVIENGVTAGVLSFATPQAAQTAFVTPDALVDSAMCFLAGTLITTPSGQTAVEQLAQGDLVLTAGGRVRPVVWVGHGRVLATRGRRTAATPVIVRKGALGPNLPHADLRVTKGHSLLLDGVLIPVEFLVNHRSILWDDRAQEVSIYHVELETHDVLLANGAAAESYRDDGNRWLFQNANAGWDRPAKAPYAPVLTGGPVVDAAWRRLLDACGPRPNVPLTDQADLHLMVDGVRVDAVTRTGDVYVFTLRTQPGDVCIVSRAAAPQEIGVASDPRCLGVAVRRVVVRLGTRFRVVGGDDPLLANGFHAFEPGTGMRWTNGDATLPAAIFAGFPGRCEVVVQLNATATYIDDGALASVA